MRPSSRSSDDADVIRARLRLLLDERRRPGGWLPDDDLDDDLDDDPDDDGLSGGEEPGSVAASWSTGPLPGPLPPVSGRPGSGLPQGLGRHRLPGVAFRLDPGRHGVWSLWTAGAVAAVLVVAWTWWQRPQVRPVPASATSASAGIGRSASTGPAHPSSSSAAASTAAALVVSVVGRVHHPGLVTLEPGARVADAVAAAGGLLPGADPASVNLAALVTDGQQIAVGVPGAPADSGGQAGSSGAGGGGPVNLNSATAADLDALPGIGPVLAQRIVDYRVQQGPFTSVDQLDDVPGIGPALFAQLRKRVAV